MMRLLRIFVLVFGVVLSKETPIEMALDIQNLFCETTSCFNESQFERNIGFNEKSNISSSNLPVRPPLYLFGCCRACSCEIPNCHIEGGCCLDALRYLPTIEDSRASIEMTCARPQLRPYQASMMANIPYSLMMIRRCRRIVDTSVRARCEHPELFSDIYSKIPVLDTTTLYSYQNRYCGACNSIDETNFVFWTPKIGCLNGIFKPKDLSTIATDIYETKDCNLMYERPLNYTWLIIPTCKLVMTTCNETGLWRKYDPFIEAACLAYTMVYNFRYKNVFCYMCNTADEFVDDCMEIPDSRTFLTFAALLKLPDTTVTRETMWEDTCDEFHIYDPVLVSCGFPMFYVLSLFTFVCPYFG